MEQRTDGSIDLARGKIEFQKVGKVFHEASTGATMRALNDFSMEISPREFVSLLGPSGCGKSSLLNIAAGFERPSTGRVLLDNREIMAPGPDRGVVFQDYALFPWLNVFQNLTYGLREKGISKSEAGIIAERYLMMVGLTGFGSRYPHELSGGMRQRVALARVLAIEPQILLMDEPFAAVDSQTRSILQQELHRIWVKTKKTVLFVTHNTDEAIYLSDRVVVMTSRPGSVKAIVTIDLPRPRNPTSNAFNDYRRDIVTMIELEARKAFEFNGQDQQLTE